jgi:hypothetical protein
MKTENLFFTAEAQRRGGVFDCGGNKVTDGSIIPEVEPIRAPQGVLPQGGANAATQWAENSRYTYIY